MIVLYFAEILAARPGSVLQIGDMFVLLWRLDSTAAKSQFAAEQTSEEQDAASGCQDAVSRTEPSECCFSPSAR